MVESEITGSAQAKTKPRTVRTAPSDRTPVINPVTTDRPQTAPGAQAMATRRRHASSANEPDHAARGAPAGIATAAGAAPRSAPGSNLAEFKMNVISDATWMKAASSGLRK